MAGQAYPKPDSQRARKNPPTFEWQRLPASGNPKPVPPMPFGTWDPLSIIWWERHWGHPCAMMWREDDPCHERLLMFADILHRERVMHSSAVLNEIRQMEDRLGLNPKARLQLRWLIVDDEGQPTELAAVKDIDTARKPRRDTR
jgi:hypothetical protein